MTVSIAPTDDTVMTAVRTLLVDVLPNTWEVFQGQGNRVPEPQGQNFVVMTPTHRNRLSTNTVDWDMVDPAPTELQHEHDVEVTVQIDIHGDGGADAASMIATLMRDDWGIQQLAGMGVTPLYATDGAQRPFLNAEHQYENRWVMEVAFQITPIVSTTAEFAATLTPTINPPLGG